MPGPLTWIARYDSASRMTHQELRGSDGNPNRVFNYSYYSSGPNIGLLQTLNDPRSVTFTYAYDGFRRPLHQEFIRQRAGAEHDLDLSL